MNVLTFMLKNGYSLYHKFNRKRMLKMTKRHMDPSHLQSIHYNDLFILFHHRLFNFPINFHDSLLLILLVRLFEVFFGFGINCIEPLP